MKPSIREDYRTGQYVPQLDGKDISPTSFDPDRALQIAQEAALNAPNSHPDAPTAPDTLPDPDRGSTGQPEGKAG